MWINRQLYSRNYPRIPNRSTTRKFIVRHVHAHVGPPHRCAIKFYESSWYWFFPASSTEKKKCIWAKKKKKKYFPRHTFGKKVFSSKSQYLSVRTRSFNNFIYICGNMQARYRSFFSLADPSDICKSGLFSGWKTRWEGREFFYIEFI